MQTVSLYYSPGQRVSLFLETLDVNGVRADGYSFPVVNRIIFPDLSLSAGFPAYMAKLDTGLYFYAFTLPTGGSSIGSYLVDVAYANPANNQINTALYQVIVNAPYGQYSMTSG